MNLKVGIVGLPNTGKSTLFNALLQKQVAFVASYPFATIEPNIGVVPVPDKRLEALAKLVEKEEGVMPPIVPAVVQFVDIAGLVKGASEGQGLGNKFLAHIREVHLICHVIRYFQDADVVHVASDLDPKRDREIIETELALSDLSTLEKQTEPRGVKDTDVQRRWELIVQLKSALNSGKQAREVIVDQKDAALIADLHLLTMKPVLLVANVSEDQLSNSQIIQLSNNQMNENALSISAKIESELAGLNVDEQMSYLKELGLEASGLDRLVKRAYETLGLISFLTCGVKEVRAWTIEKGSKAPQAAGTIHTDFEKKFIKADVIPFDEFVRLGGWKRAREQGIVRSEGKEYLVQDGDVIEFKVGT